MRHYIRISRDVKGNWRSGARAEGKGTNARRGFVMSVDFLTQPNARDASQRTSLGNVAIRELEDGSRQLVYENRGHIQILNEVVFE
jgi:hypothetical protein